MILPDNCSITVFAFLGTQRVTIIYQYLILTSLIGSSQFALTVTIPFTDHFPQESLRSHRSLKGGTKIWVSKRPMSHYHSHITYHITSFEHAHSTKWTTPHSQLSVFGFWEHYLKNAFKNVLEPKKHGRGIYFETFCLLRFFPLNEIGILERIEIGSLISFVLLIVLSSASNNPHLQFWDYSLL